MNVLFVVLGSARADHLSCAGYQRETTPFLDEIARDGVRYQNMVSTAPSAVAAHVSLMTGLFAATHGVTEESPVVPARWRLLAEHLRQAGYHTAAFCAHPRLSAAAGFGRGFDGFWGTVREQGLAGRAVRYARDAGARVLGRPDLGPRRLTQSLVEWLGATAEPFFAFVHYDALRSSAGPPAPYDRMFLSNQAAKGRRGGGRRGAPSVIDPGTGAAPVDPDTLRARYDGTLRYLDDCLREVGRALQGRGSWEETVLVVTADHGANLGDHPLPDRRPGLYDCDLRIPLVLRCPSLLPRGFVVEGFAQSVDVAPTVLRLAGIETDLHGLHGHSLFVDGQACAGRPFAVAESFRRPAVRAGRLKTAAGVEPLATRRKAIRTRREKFIWDSLERNELYDLIQDPHERRNIIEEAPERAAPLRRGLFDWLASVDRLQTAPSVESISVP